MDFTNKNILIVSPEPWDDLFVSKHHYATHLAKMGNSVYFLGPPTNQSKVKASSFKGVWNIEYRGFPKGIRFYLPILRKYFIKQKFEELQKLCGVEFDIIWSFDNSVFFDFSALPMNVYSISHIVDWNQDFEFASAARTANLCLASSSYILSKQRKYNSNTYFIQHGFLLSPYNSSEQSLPGKNKTKAFYAGNLSIPYIDWNLLHNLVESHHEVDFCFAGKGNDLKAFKNLQTFSNVYYLGVLNAADLHARLSMADILLLVYQADKYPEQLANPHKLMQYFGVGKCIVSTWTEEYMALASEHILMMASNREDYLTKFKVALQSLETLNNMENQALRKGFALDNTYELQIKRIQALTN